MRGSYNRRKKVLGRAICPVEITGGGDSPLRSAGAIRYGEGAEQF